MVLPRSLASQLAQIVFAKLPAFAQKRLKASQMSVVPRVFNASTQLYLVALSTKTRQYRSPPTAITSPEPTYVAMDLVEVAIFGMIVGLSAR